MDYGSVVYWMRGGGGCIWICHTAMCLNDSRTKPPLTKPLGQNHPDKTPRTIPRWTKPPNGQIPPWTKPPWTKPPGQNPPDKTPRTKPPRTKPPPDKTPRTKPPRTKPPSDKTPRTKPPGQNPPPPS